MPEVTIQRALLSVSDKSGIVELAKDLKERGIELLSTGGTARLLQQAGLTVTEVSDYTGFPEMMEGRVKTLHPKIHGGLLGRRDEDHDIMQDHHILDIDLAVINLYPFQKIAQQASSTLSDCIENIDIGGPAMIRSAAKNFAWVSVVVDPRDYQDLIQQLDKGHGSVTHAKRFEWAQKAFTHTAGYDGAIADHLGRFDDSFQKGDSSKTFHMSLHLDRPLRYGENPQQRAALYRESTSNTTTLSQAEQVQGKPLSFNNLVDAEAALMCCYQFNDPACVIVKHANPCGVSCASSLLEAYHKAFACDPSSSFGGIVALNHTVDADVCSHIVKNQFLEVLIAPQFTQEALNVLQNKPNVRALQTGTNTAQFNDLKPDFKRIRGGVLVQDWDDVDLKAEDCQVVTRLAPSNSQWDDLLFAWNVVKFVKSNAIVFAKNGQTLGIGAGQMSRVFSVEIAKLRAQQQEFSLEHACLASDAFFPFKDNIELAASYGIKSIIQPGGSKRDTEVIDACDALGINMVFTHQRHFRH